MRRINLCCRYGPMLRTLRMQQGLSLKDFSLKSGIRIATLSDAERDRYVIGIDTFERIAKALGYSVKYFINNGMTGDSQTADNPYPLVKYARLKAGMTQKELARKQSISQPYLNGIERQRLKSSILLMYRLLRKCGYTLDLSLVPNESPDNPYPRPTRGGVP